MGNGFFDVRGSTDLAAINLGLTLEIFYDRFRARVDMELFVKRRDELLLKLVQDPEPEVRMNAVWAAHQNWNPRFFDPLINLFSDEDEEVRRAATQVLALHNKDFAERTPLFLKLPQRCQPRCPSLRVAVADGHSEHENSSGRFAGDYWLSHKKTWSVPHLACCEAKNRFPRMRLFRCCKTRWGSQNLLA